MTAVRDIMGAPTVILRPDLTLMEAATLLVGHHVEGAPVVDFQGKLIGFVSESELLEIAFDLSARDANVTEFMTRDVHAIAAAAPIVRLAQLFALFPCRRLPVLEDGRLVGIVSRRDLLNHALRTNQVVAEPLSEMIPELATFG